MLNGARSNRRSGRRRVALVGALWGTGNSRVAGSERALTRRHANCRGPRGWQVVPVLVPAVGRWITPTASGIRICSDHSVGRRPSKFQMASNVLISELNVGGHVDPSSCGQQEAKESKRRVHSEKERRIDMMWKEDVQASAILSPTVPDSPNQPSSVRLQEHRLYRCSVLRAESESIGLPIVVGVFGDTHPSTCRRKNSAPLLQPGKRKVTYRQ